MGRTITGTVRLTPAEKEWLTSRYGAVPSGLREALNQLMAAKGTQAAPAQGQLGDGFAGLDGLDALDDKLIADQTPTAGHRHRRGEALGTHWDSGTPVKIFRCQDPACTVTLTA